MSDGPRVMPPPRPWPPADAGPTPRRRGTSTARRAAEGLLYAAGWRWSTGAGGWVHPARRGQALSYRAACRAAGLT